MATAMDVLERAFARHTMETSTFVGGAALGTAFVVGTAPMWNAFFQLLFSQYGLACIAVVSIVGGLQMALFVVALRELAKRDSAYVAARSAEDARATAQLQADSIMALRDALARFGDDANDVAVAMIKEGPHMLATVATQAGLKRILEGHARRLRPEEVMGSSSSNNGGNWVDAAVHGAPSSPSRASTASPSPSPSRPARSPPRRAPSMEPVREEQPVVQAAHAAPQPAEAEAAEAQEEGQGPE